MSFGAKIKRSIPLKNLTTFKIGGPAKFFAEIKEKQDLQEAWQWSKEKKVDIVLLGGGSNVLINDAGVDSLLLQMNNLNLSVRGNRMDSGAGVTLSILARQAQSNSLSGLEWANGIPGASLGGAIRGNAGAFGKNMQDMVETVEVFDKKEEKFKIFSNKDCQFEYRGSIFKNQEDYIIWNANIKLQSFPYKQIAELTDNYLGERRNKQPNLPSAGCIFKNLTFAELQEFNPGLADYAKQQKAVKGDNVAAAWLIDMLDLKGKSMGGAKISLQHANFIVNTGKATSLDVISLISYIKEKVRNRFKVQLQEEIQYLGF